MTADCVIVVTVTLIVAVDWATVFIKICKLQVKINHFEMIVFLSSI